MEKENIKNIAEGTSAENSFFGQKITQKLLLVVFLVSFFTIIVGILGTDILRREWKTSYTLTTIDIKVISNLLSLEENVSEQSSALNSLLQEKNAENKIVLQKVFDDYSIDIEKLFENLQVTLNDELEINLGKKAYSQYKNFSNKSKNILNDPEGNLSINDILSEGEVVRETIFEMSRLIQDRTAKNTATLTKTYASTKRNLLFISIFGIIFISLIGVFFGKKILLAPVLSVEKHAENLTNLNKELNEKNKLLVEREIELSEVNKKLQNLDATRSEFVSIVAHQLRTPLAGIKWTLDMLINGDMGQLSIEQKTMLMKILETNERIVRFVNDLLSISRIESGRLEYNFVPVNLQHVAESVLLDIYPLANKKRVLIVFRAKGLSLPSVAADTEKIRVVFQNILENAVKYTPEGGHITLDLRNRGSEVLVSVADEGIGIPKDEQDGIFKRFYRAPSAIKIESEGSGLGLYLARAIVEGHGGRLWFESAKGKGSYFYFTIPVPRKMV